MDSNSGGVMFLVDFTSRQWREHARCHQKASIPWEVLQMTDFHKWFCNVLAPCSDSLVTSWIDTWDFFQDEPFQASVPFIFVIITYSSNCQIKFCWGWDSNHQSLVSEVIALPTESQPPLLIGKSQHCWPILNWLPMLLGNLKTDYFCTSVSWGECRRRRLWSH